MNIIRTHYEGNLSAFTVTNSDNEQFTEIDCPSGITARIDAAIARGETAGTTAGNGLLWRWHKAPDPKDSVALEFTRNNEVVYAFDIPKTSWQAFELVSARNGHKAKDYLSFCIANCLNEGDPLEEVIEWIFSVNPAPARSPEVQRFDSATERFHRGEIRAVQLPDGVSWKNL